MNIKELIYKSLDFLPSRMCRKIQLCGTILFGKNWDYYVPIFDMETTRNLCNVTYDDIEKTYIGLSEEDIKTLKIYLDYKYFDVRCGTVMDNNTYSIIIPYNALYIKDKINYENLVCKKARKESGFKYCVPEVFCYHHGLTFLSKEVISYIKDTIFFDLGAFNGDSAYVFSKYSPKKIISFEPSIQNGKEYLKNIKRCKISNAQLAQLGVSDRPGKFYISEEKNSATTLNNNNGYPVEIVTIDDYVSQHEIGRIGVIKADLEGMEPNMVRGAIKTIIKHRPVLLLSIYHNSEELLGLYQYLTEKINDYNYMVRALSKYGEITLIAYPK